MGVGYHSVTFAFARLRDFSVALVLFKARALAEATVQLAASTGSEAIA